MSTIVHMQRQLTIKRQFAYETTTINWETKIQGQTHNNGSSFKNLFYIYLSE